MVYPLLEVLLCDVRTLPKLAESADSDVPLETHDDRAVHRTHHRYLKRRQKYCLFYRCVVVHGIYDQESFLKKKHWNYERRLLIIIVGTAWQAEE